MSLAHLHVRNVELLKLIANLREHIDVHRIISLNASRLVKPHFPETFLAYVHRCAIDGIGIRISQIFEIPGKYELNSILGVARMIKQNNGSPLRPQLATAFCREHGKCGKVASHGEMLERAFYTFAERHGESLCVIKEYRDKIGAHSEANVALRYLPSHDEFEALIGFAFQFYSVVTVAFLGMVAAVLHPRVEMSLTRWAKQVSSLPIQRRFAE